MFDPRSHLIRLRDKRGYDREYLPVQARVAWFRDRHPDGSIVTEALTISPEVAVFRATISTSDGLLATGHGTQTPQQFVDYVEKAETKAVGRALAVAGFGTQFTADLDEGDREDGPAIVDSPIERRVDATRVIKRVIWDAAKRRGFATGDELRAWLSEMAVDVDLSRPTIEQAEEVLATLARDADASWVARLVAVSDPDALANLAMDIPQDRDDYATLMALTDDLYLLRSAAS